MSTACTTTRTTASVLAALTLAASTFLASCNIIGPAYVLAAGPEKQKALFTLDRERPTVIFVDDRASVLPRRTLRQTVAKRIESELLGQKSLTTVIDSSTIAGVASRDPADSPTDIASLGKSVSAEVVIYVSLDRFAVSPDGQVYQPFADARVKVLDITKQQPRVWPQEREGYTASLIMPQGRNNLPATPAAAAAAQETLAAELGVTIARLFFTHESGSRASTKRE